MSDLKYTGCAGTDAVKKLRVVKLRQGHPFMINSRELPDGQCYLEYPTGSIVLATLSKSSRDFIILRELSALEIVTLRKKFNLEPVFQ
jgi:hypothetical protein